ncbi:hypothetical protein AMAG_02074 [Allomyces macrogynus ATCC 38327]|uniref:Uncharacterized protein n=1 Tax=Allomyces macrogynus (strain ATCC 38327) TaxID=578462 RepID=A0A0L0S1H2_ALLM3|nr:hypothetical protein AMAG_02074 [Allomyces macrogynus ATCC 38327]|eukprot:KNE56241.1 hypothetical protein AMAG_02074 [Allomyces macrogynus ATCC 38327]
MALFDVLSPFQHRRKDRADDGAETTWSTSWSSSWSAPVPAPTSDPAPIPPSKNVSAVTPPPPADTLHPDASEKPANPTSSPTSAPKPSDTARATTTDRARSTAPSSTSRPTSTEPSSTKSTTSSSTVKSTGTNSTVSTTSASSTSTSSPTPTPVAPPPGQDPTLPACSSSSDFACVVDKAKCFQLGAVEQFRGLAPSKVLLPIDVSGYFKERTPTLAPIVESASRNVATADAAKSLLAASPASLATHWDQYHLDVIKCNTTNHRWSLTAVVLDMTQYYRDRNDPCALATTGLTVCPQSLTERATALRSDLGNATTCPDRSDAALAARDAYLQRLQNFTGPFIAADAECRGADTLGLDPAAWCGYSSPSVAARTACPLVQASSDKTAAAGSLESASVGAQRVATIAGSTVGVVGIVLGSVLAVRFWKARAASKKATKTRFFIPPPSLARLGTGRDRAAPSMPPSNQPPMHVVTTNLIPSGHPLPPVLMHNDMVTSPVPPSAASSSYKPISLSPPPPVAARAGDMFVLPSADDGQFFDIPEAEMASVLSGTAAPWSAVSSGSAVSTRSETLRSSPGAPGLGSSRPPVS